MEGPYPSGRKQYKRVELSGSPGDEFPQGVHGGFALNIQGPHGLFVLGPHRFHRLFVLALPLVGGLAHAAQTDVDQSTLHHANKEAQASLQKGGDHLPVAQVQGGLLVGNGGRFKLGHARLSSRFCNPFSALSPRLSTAMSTKTLSCQK